jgi:Protein of unknown function (DUF3618)
MTADELRQEIEQTRQSLGETVDELAAKADMKARIRAKAGAAKAQAQARIAEVSGRMKRSQAIQRRWPVAVAAALAAGAGAMAIRRRKRTERG